VLLYSSIYRPIENSPPLPLCSLSSAVLSSSLRERGLLFTFTFTSPPCLFPIPFPSFPLFSYFFLPFCIFIPLGVPLHSISARHALPIDVTRLRPLSRDFLHNGEDNGHMTLSLSPRDQSTFGFHIAFRRGPCPVRQAGYTFQIRSNAGDPFFTCGHLSLNLCELALVWDDSGCGFTQTKKGKSGTTGNNPVASNLRGATNGRSHCCGIHGTPGRNNQTSLFFYDLWVRDFYHD